MLRLRNLLLFAALCVGASCKMPGRTVIECGGGGEFLCPSGTYCDLGRDCGGIDKKGGCRPMITDCPPENKPVCGCDGKTYQSACYANGSGITVNYDGPCITEAPH